jgi:zinc transporter 2
MFFTLHANVCGNSIPHHGHSHGGGGHGHGENHARSPREDHGHSHEEHHGHSHDGSHDHNDTIINAEPIITDIANGEDRDVAKVKKASSNINVRAAIIHVIGDFVQSVGVLCAAILIKFKVYWKIIK